MNDYYKDQLRKLIVKYKRAIDKCETKEEIKNLLDEMRKEIDKYESNVL